MDKEVAFVLQGFEKLSDKQKKIFLEQIKSLDFAGHLRESVRKQVGMVLGPLEKGCPCCGR